MKNLSFACAIGVLLCLTLHSINAADWELTHNISVPKKQIGKIDAHSGPVQYLAFSPSGILLASSRDNPPLKIWNNKGELIGTISEFVGSGLSWSRDGETLATASSLQVAIWSSKTWTQRNPVKIGGSSKIVDISYTTDGKYVLSTGTPLIQRWDVFATGGPTDTLGHGRSELGTCISVSPSGDYTAVISYEENIQIFRDLEATCFMSASVNLKEAYYALAWHPSLFRIAVTGHNESSHGQLRVWDVNTKVKILSADTQYEAFINRSIKYFTLRLIHGNCRA